jgi:hypothetical protein
LAAVAGLLAPQAHATSWCPSSTDYTITCTNCSRELTCDVYNTSIEIYGSNVTLDGQGHTIYYSPGPGITAYNSPATIQNVDVYYAGSGQSQSQPGILFTKQDAPYQLLSYVQYCEVYSATGDGIVNQSNGPVEISGSYTTWGGNIGVLADGSSGAYTDFLHSITWGNYGSGYYTEKPNSYIIGSTLSSNATGLFANADWLKIDSNGFEDNTYGLLMAGGNHDQVTNNSGSTNSSVDCYDNGVTNLTHYSNSWANWSGSGCVP